MKKLLTLALAAVLALGTSSRESVKALMAAVEKQAKAGNMEVVLVDNAE